MLGLFLYMVEAQGFEPWTSWSRTKRATKLHHASMCRILRLVYYTIWGNQFKSFYLLFSKRKNSDRKRERIA